MGERFHCFACDHGSELLNNLTRPTVVERIKRLEVAQRRIVTVDLGQVTENPERLIFIASVEVITGQIDISVSSIR